MSNSEIPINWPWPSNMTGRLHTELRAERMKGEVAAASDWRHAAEADGWEFSQTYKHEPVEHAFRVSREGFIVLGLARPGGYLLPTGSINVWGPDSLSIDPVPIVYPGFAALKSLARRCPECGTEDVDTMRVSFANRCCANCAQELRKELERPGWCY